MFNIFQSLLNDPSFESEVKHIRKTFHINDKILEQGKTHASIYMIIKGSVRVVVSGHTNDEIAVHLGVADLQSGQVFGELGLFDDSPANADVVAVTEGELIEIDILSLREFLDKNPKIGYKILMDMFQMIVERLRRADKTIVYLYGWGLNTHQINKYLE